MYSWGNGLNHAGINHSLWSQDVDSSAVDMEVIFALFFSDFSLAGNASFLVKKCPFPLLFKPVGCYGVINTNSSCRSKILVSKTVELSKHR